jgi:putative hydrolase of the HAD superfamily
MDKRYEHIFFDLDRTLWNFDENSKKVLNDIYVNFKLNGSISSSSLFIEKYQEINQALWALYRDDKLTKEELRWKRFQETLIYFNVSDEEMSIQMGDYYIEHSPRQTLLFPNCIEVLDYLSKKYKLHIITNGFEEVQHIKLKESGLRNYFEVLIFSETAGVKKPHPYIFKKALKEAGAKANNSIMIGDDLYADIYGSQRVKMDNVYFNPNKVEHNKYVQHEINCLSKLFGIL